MMLDLNSKFKIDRHERYMEIWWNSMRWWLYPYKKPVLKLRGIIPVLDEVEL